jgi:hypothetical protein
VTSADPESIRADLTVLRPRFDSLITYDAIHGAESIPAIAAAREPPASLHRQSDLDLPVALGRRRRAHDEHP